MFEDLRPHKNTKTQNRPQAIIRVEVIQQNAMNALRTFHTQTNSLSFVARATLERHGRSLGCSLQTYRFHGISATPDCKTNLFAKRGFSSFDPSAIVKSEPGFVTRKLRALNMKTVKQVMQELKAVDANADERYCSMFSSEM